jgi:hypothetical protein
VADFRDTQIRYLVHFSDGGAGMRHRDEPLEEGIELTDGGTRYVIVRVTAPPGPASFGHAWAERRHHG